MGITNISRLGGSPFDVGTRTIQPASSGGTSSSSVRLGPPVPRRAGSSDKNLLSSAEEFPLWFLVVLFLDLKSLGRFLTVAKTGSGLDLSEEEEEVLFQHLAYASFALCVPSGPDAFVPEERCRIYWKQLVRKNVGANNVTNNIVRVNGLELYVCGNAQDVVDRPLRPGTLFGLPFGGGQL